MRAKLQNLARAWHKQQRTFENEYVKPLHTELDKARYEGEAIGLRWCAEDLERLLADNLDWKEPAPEVKGTFPVVLYFDLASERDEFIAAVKQAKPNLRERKL